MLIFNSIKHKGEIIFMFVLFIIIILIIAALISIFGSKSANKKEKEKTFFNQKFDEAIKNNNIQIAKFIDLNFSDSKAKFIVDEQNKKCCYINVSKEATTTKLFDFKDVYKVELIKDSKVKLVESQFSIFDTYNKKEYVKKFGLRISFNDLSFTHLDILFLNSLTGQTLFGLNHVVESTNSWIQIMNIVIERGKEERAC